jgi:hypothetical protein
MPRFVVQVAADGRVIQFDDCDEQEVIDTMRQLYPEPTRLARAERRCNSVPE